MRAALRISASGSSTSLLMCAASKIADLMEGESPHIYSFDITRKGEGLPIARRKGLSYQRLAPKFRNKLAEPFLVTIPYIDEEFRVPHPHSHEGQEMDIVISGQLKVQVGDNVEILNEGDSISTTAANPMTNGLSAARSVNSTPLFAVSISRSTLSRTSNRSFSPALPTSTLQESRILSRTSSLRSRPTPKAR